LLRSILEHPSPPNTPWRSRLSNQGKPASRRGVQEEEIESKFITGDDLHRLRHEVFAMRLELQEARRSSSKERVRALERAIMIEQQLDAEFVYTVSLERHELAEQKGIFQDTEKFKLQAMEARSALPQYNLESDYYRLLPPRGMFRIDKNNSVLLGDYPTVQF